MAQKLLIMERDTKEELAEAIKKELEDANFIVRSCSVLEQQIDITDEKKKFRLDRGWNLPKHYEVWIIIDDKSDYIAGFE